MTQDWAFITHALDEFDKRHHTVLTQIADEITHLDDLLFRLGNAVLRGPEQAPVSQVWENYKMEVLKSIVRYRDMLVTATVSSALVAAKEQGGIIDNSSPH